MINYKKEIKVIGFDLDQTLYPKSPKIDEAIQSYIYEKIAEHKNCGIEKAKELFKDLYKDGKGLSGSETLIELEIPNAKDIVQEALENADISSFLKPDTKISRLLENLKKKYSLDIITGSNNKNTEIKLKKLNIPKNLFNNIITSDMASKSNSEAYKQWLDMYNKHGPREFLYIGDRVSSDYIVPKKLNIETILVNIKNKHDDVNCLQLESLIKINNLLL